DDRHRPVRSHAAERYADPCLNERAARHETDYARAPRTQRHANSQLARSTRHAVANASVDAEGAEEEAEQREAIEHDRVEAAAVEFPVERFLIGGEGGD